MSRVIYPGTFDPITNGHLDIIQRSAALFDEVIVAVANSPSKKPLFDLEQRVELVEQSCAHLPNVRVIGFSDLLAKLAQDLDIKAIIRGVRTVQDFEYELQMSHLNRMLSKGENKAGIETLFLPPNEKYAFVSSTFVREIFLHQGEVAELVPSPVFKALQAKSEQRASE